MLEFSNRRPCNESVRLVRITASWAIITFRMIARLYSRQNLFGKFASGRGAGPYMRIGYGTRFIVRTEEIRAAFIELQRAIHSFAVDLIS